ncbi:WD40-repeat-containing domain protein [Zopfochytrium polystomum]|nr:WD40-repeat-containing domain protein [Zopfochytrium polystomum]
MDFVLSFFLFFDTASMVLQVTHHNNVKIYSVTSAGRSALPDWLAKRKAKSLKKDQEYRSRIELIQDFQFPEASLKLKYTPDGNYIMATGVYKPQIRVYDLQELSMKFDRHTDCENVAFEILTDDWQKSIHLQLDRSVEIHAQYGLHYKTRIPKFGRELKYHAPTCDVYFAAASPEIYRLNLEQGRFLSPFVSSSPSLATLALSDAHGLLAAGGDDGCVEFWNPEDRKRLSRLNVAEWLVKEWNGGSSLDAFPAITALSFHPDGLKCSVGVASGHVLLYDLRKPVPTLVKEHPYQLPIKYVGFHPSGRAVSADAKVVRFWNKDNGELFTSIEPPYDINDVAIPGDTGLVAIANEGVDIQTFYVPELGPAPRWCSFLDNLTEELEENPNGLSMYDDYKFLSRKELARLGLDQLIGTNLLKAYMHGFFVDLRLYQKAKAIADPFEYAEHRRKLIEKKLEQERKTRIHSKNKLPRVNARLAQRLMKSSGETDAKKKKAPMMAAIQSDDRFAGLFQDAEFEIDEDSSEFRIHNSSAARPAADRSIPSLFEKADDEDISEDESGDDEEAETQPKSKRGPTLYELKSTSSSSLPLKQRLASESTETSSDRIRSTGAGNKSLTFTPGTDRNKRFRTASRPRPSTDDDGPRRVRRGVKELGLKRLPGPGVFKKRK